MRRPRQEGITLKRAHLPIAGGETDTNGTAPGIRLFDAVHYYVNRARQTGYITSNEAAIMLSAMHTSARAALGEFHTLDLVHGHAHLNNFSANIATGGVKLFDYTMAMEFGEEVAYVRPEQSPPMMNDVSPDQDITSFETRWKNLLEFTGCSDTCLTASDAEQKAALAKLERTAIYGALSVLTGANPSEDDVDRYLEARRELICDAPTVSYPKASTLEN